MPPLRAAGRASPLFCGDDCYLYRLFEDIIVILRADGDFRLARGDAGERAVLIPVGVTREMLAVGKGFKLLLRILFSNNLWRWFVVTTLLYYGSSSITQGLLIYYVRDYIGNSSLVGLASLMSMISGFFAIILLQFFAKKIETVKRLIPDAFIGVDVMVGTRGETPEYFDRAYRFIEGLDVTQLHVFSYSERPGTQALKIDYVVSPEEKHRRSQLLLALSDRKLHDFYASHIGQKAEVLMEKAKPGVAMHGFTKNYIRVELAHDDSLDNHLLQVRLGDFNAEGTSLKGTVL